MDVKEKKVIELNWLDILKTACGRNAEGNANAIAALSVDELRNAGKLEEDVINRASIALNNASLHISSSGGCVVIQADFPSTSGFEYKRALDTCKGWLQNIHMAVSPDYLQMLTLTVIPLPLYGQITILFDQLVYVYGHSFEKGFRLIMAFDNEMTQCFESDEINYNEILSMIQAEIKRQEERMDAEIDELEKELKESENDYAKMMEEKAAQVEFDSQKELKEMSNPDMRIVEENPEMRFTED